MGTVTTVTTVAAVATRAVFALAAVAAFAYAADGDNDALECCEPTLHLLLLFSPSFPDCEVLCRGETPGGRTFRDPTMRQQRMVGSCCFLLFKGHQARTAF